MKYSAEELKMSQKDFNNKIHEIYRDVESKDNLALKKYGDWARTIDGNIYEISKMLAYIFVTDVFYYQITAVSDEKLELIEEGDYVNGKEVITIIPTDVCGDETLSYPRFYTDTGEVPYEQLETLVTKEKFDSQKISIKKGE